MEKRIKHYQGLLEHNGYINTEAVMTFLEDNCIADYGVISEIYGKGLSVMDYQDLQEAIERVRNTEEE